jgi:hypothetical protein
LIHAFIDEAGDRSRRSPVEHFVMSAVVIPEPHILTSGTFLAELRKETGRRSNDTLHWRNFPHPERVHASKRLGSQDWLTISSVVVCKRSLTGPILNDDHAYLYTLRYLLERLSWLARDSGSDLTYTLAHIVRFKMEKLREYEQLLRLNPECRVAWEVLGGRGGAIDQPSRIEQLQLADIAASATWAAFEKDRYGNCETRYLFNLGPRLYRRGRSPLTSYGLKIHPFNATTEAAYPWVAAL